LDSYHLKDVYFIKIDADGHELKVLRGAQRMLKNCSSVFLVKFAENNLEAVTDFVKRYRLHESAAIRKPAENIEVKSRFRKTKRKG
jgi:hypothetical protein